MRRLHVLLAGCVVAGGAALLTGNGPSGAPSAAIGGPAIDPDAPPASEVAAFANLAIDDGAPKSGQTKGKSKSKGKASGVRAVSAGAIDTVDLDKITRDGDHYVAPLADGRKAVLTLDPDLQELAEKLLDESRAPRGAIVAMAPDGRILALAGRKTEETTGSRTGTFDWRLATDAWAPAASIFKLVTASALVQAGVDPDAKVCYHGGIRSVLEHNLRDDKRDSRCESLSYGVAHSQNAILGKLAYQKLDPTTLEAMAKTIGWLDPVKHLNGVVGELSLPQVKDLEFARAAAGFKGARLSVLGGALVAATFAEDGEQPVPRLVSSIDGVMVVSPPARRAITADHARAVARMMAGTCTDGSAARTFARARKVTVAGKTGTLTRTDPFYMEHSWFVGFAPVDTPQLVVSVVLGNPESWHLRGHEAARRMIDRALAPSKSASARAKGRSTVVVR
ncbi:MAG: penicillin-binding transpeptidase domain-containing protein [Myxococcota bacterium]|nr:penicillin-binding transpeptidase domain-containing protein [Myxococcota bacterium]